MGNNKKENNSRDSDNQVRIRIRTKAANDIIFEQNAH